MSDLEKFARTILGVIFMMGTMISVVWCLYKYAKCQERKEKQKVLPMEENI